jgi:hypothetical protein
MRVGGLRLFGGLGISLRLEPNNFLELLYSYYSEIISMLSCIPIISTTSLWGRHIIGVVD